LPPPGMSRRRSVVKIGDGCQIIGFRLSFIALLAS
jgi:hypothetical protein